MAKEKLLIVDDERRIREMIREYIDPAEYDITEAADGKMALDLFKRNEYSLIILDVMMPEMDGWTVTREIRKTSAVPIILLTAKGEEYDKLFGFELGVDDYLVKPFSPRELLARIKAIIRRGLANRNESGKFQMGGLSVDLEARNVLVDGQVKNLTPKEFELLSFLLQHPNKVFSRDQLLNSVWGYDYIGDSRTVDTHIKMLRESLGVYRKLIITVWGTGYKLVTGGEG